MKIKMLMPFMLLMIGIFLTSCEKENLQETTNVEVVDGLESRKGDDGPGVPCIDDGVPETDCDCVYRIDYLQDQFQEWTLENYGNNSRCCFGGNYFDAVDVTDGYQCNGTDLNLGQWRSMNCGLKQGEINFRFTSQDCDDECPYEYNKMKVTVRCKAQEDNPHGENQSEVSFWLYANQNGPCTQGIGVNSILLDADCDLRP